jgi:hypothetical protein
MPPSLNVSLLGRQFPQTHAMFSHPRFSVPPSLPFLSFYWSSVQGIQQRAALIGRMQRGYLFPIGWLKEGMHVVANRRGADRKRRRRICNGSLSEPKEENRICFFCYEFNCTGRLLFSVYTV